MTDEERETQERATITLLALQHPEVEKELESARVYIAGLEQQIATLTEALYRLMKESAAVVALAETVLRDEIGHTNVAVFKLRVDEAGAALAAVRGEQK